MNSWQLPHICDSWVRGRVRVWASACVCAIVRSHVLRLGYAVRQLWAYNLRSKYPRRASCVQPPRRYSREHMSGQPQHVH